MSDFPGAPDSSASALPGGRLRVLAAMSGGVDSAVAAARAVEDGHEVTGVHLALASNPQSFRTGARGCCTLEDSRDARRAADVIGIPFYVWDLAERFREDVIDDFVAEYAAGRTPNPCLRCNEKIKFAALLDKAVALGFDAVCTGHYARIIDEPARGRTLHRAVDPAKDQSYVLGVLDADQLAHAMFPLGDTPKGQVRVEAEQRGLAVAKKPDSHDICFIADGDTQGFLAQRLGSATGEIVDVDGTVVGEHSGAFGFTIGQRKGLRIGRPAADGKPRYVLDISPVDNRVTVGPVEALDIAALSGVKPRWCGEQTPVGTGRYHAQLRAHGEPVPVTAEIDADGGLRVVLDEPVRGIAPGQAVVLYDGTRVVGSATIATTERSVHQQA
ncbi:tRNA-specific 2-thiouridylase [Streptacidiphilus sp. MAP12-20]|uniref:tRNA 2-thiouridine(34) synthase MnmA n=1 Tax=Streptacidiphilus sp. MAP12-20 TaxID=3156299 RepID=UPI003510E6BA